MSAHVAKAELAEIDLLEIWLHIAADNAMAADRLVRRIEATCRRLAEFPGLGQACDDYLPRLRSMPVGNCLLFYRPVKDGIELVRVLHRARDVKRFFGRP